MINRAHRSYHNLQAETAVRAATPGELIVLVYDRILDHLRDSARLVGEAQDCAVPVQKALDLIGEGLIAALDREHGGEIVDNLAGLYDWAMRTILRARIRKDPAMLQDVINVLTPLREAWVEANATLKQPEVA